MAFFSSTTYNRYHSLDFSLLNISRLVARVSSSVLCYNVNQRHKLLLLNLSRQGNTIKCLHSEYNSPVSTYGQASMTPTNRLHDCVLFRLNGGWDCVFFKWIWFDTFEYSVAVKAKLRYVFNQRQPTFLYTGLTCPQEHTLSLCYIIENPGRLISMIPF